MAKKTFFITLAALIAFVVLAVLALQGFTDLLENPSTVISGAKCEPPCWRGITPGQEDPYHIFEMLSGMNDVNMNSIAFQSDKDDQIESIYWAFQRPAPDGTGTVYFAEERVTAISILTINALNLGELFERLGEPDHYWAEVGQREYNEYLRVYLFFPQGCVADVLIDFESGDEQVTLKQSTPVFRVTYYDPARYDSLLETRILIEKVPNARTGRLTPWPGYGAIPIEGN